MPGILESLTSMVTPEMLNQVSKATGVDPALLSTGLSAVGATTMGSLAQSAKTPEGAAELMKKLPAETAEGASPTDMLSGLMSSVTGGTGGTSADMLNGILGSGSNAISGTLSKTLGFNVAPLMAIGAPMVMGLVSKAAKSGGLDATGVADMLKTQSDEFMKDPANAEVAKAAQSALEAGDKASKLRASFTDQEWNAVRKAPLAAVGLVVAASPSKGRGAAQELGAAAAAVLDSAGAADPTSLVGSGFGGGLTQAEIDGLQNATPTSASAIEAIKAGVAVVKQKDPSAAQAYTAMISNAAAAAAGAAKEGGFLGIGGTQVSEQEQAALSAVNAALA